MVREPNPQFRTSVLRVYAAAMVFMCTHCVQAATYYVRTTGNDGAGGTTPATAWLTVQHAVDQAVAGDRVHVGAGTYNESVAFANDGTAINRIEFYADTSGAMTGDAGTVTIAATGASALTINGDDYITINGFWLAGSTAAVVEISNSTNARIEDCNISGATGTGDGIQITAADAVVSGCTIWNNLGDGIGLRSNGIASIAQSVIRANSGCGVEALDIATQLSLSRSRIIQNGTWGIDINLGTSTIVNCFINRNGSGGMQFDGDNTTTADVWHSTLTWNSGDGLTQINGATTIRNCILAFNTDDGIDKDGGVLTHTYNVSHGNGSNDFEGIAASTGEVTTDPLLLGSNDYRLAAASPALDNGTDGSAATTVDLDGTARPVGGGWDIGCYEGAGATVQFADVSAATGFDVQTTTDQHSGSGLHWGDVNGDGYPDAVITGNSLSRIMRNNNGATFTVGTLGTGSHVRQGALLDVDNDGDLDFWQRGNRLFQNNGAGTLTNLGSSGMASPSNAEGVAAADVDHDGNCDVIVFAGNGNWLGLNRATTTPSVTESNSSVYGLNDSGDSGNGEFCSSTDMDDDGLLDILYHYNGGKFFQSQGDETFYEDAAGISFVTGGSDKTGSAWGDYDNDGDMDVFVPRFDAGFVGYLYRNDAGTFTDVTVSSGMTDVSGQRSAAWGDYDNDGDLDLYLVTRANEANILYENQGGGTFVLAYEGADAPGDGHDAVFVDFDIDGDLDIAVTQEDATNTLLENLLDNDQYLKVRVVGFGQGGTNRAGIGVRVDLYDAANTTFIARRHIGVARGLGSEPIWPHFGGVNSATAYTVRVYFLSGTVAQVVTPNAVQSTIGGTVVQQMITITEQPVTTLSVFGWSESDPVYP